MVSFSKEGWCEKEITKVSLERDVLLVRLNLLVEYILQRGRRFCDPSL